MSKTLFAILISLTPFTLVACGSTEAAPAQTAKAPPSSTGDAQTTCVEVMTKGRTCTSEFIPALVESRAKHDNPQGIAEAVQKDRNAVVSQALTEWATDSKDEAIARTCQQMVGQAPDAGDVDAGRACLAQADCAAYVACIIPQFEKRFAK